MKLVQRLKEKNRWMLVCVAILIVAAVAISLILVYTPREAPPEEAEAAETAALTVPPSPTAAPEPSPTAEPVITPPAKSAVSGSDVILQHVPRTTESDLNGGPGLAGS